MPLQPPVRCHDGPPPYPLLSAHLPLECQPCTDKGLLTAVAPGPSTVPGTLYAQHSQWMRNWGLVLVVHHSFSFVLWAVPPHQPGSHESLLSAQVLSSCDIPSSAHPQGYLLLYWMSCFPPPPPRWCWVFPFRNLHTRSYFLSTVTTGNDLL